MSEIKNGGPAYPHGFIDHGREQTRASAGAVTLRDYFAAKAMAALAGQLDAEDAAKEAYERADAMILAREAK